MSGAAVAAVGALLLGEYPMDGATALVGAVLLGLVVAEVVITVAGRRGLPLAAAAAACAGLGMLGAVWVWSGEDWSYVSGAGWVGVVLAGAAAAAWVRAPGRRAGGSPRGP